MPDIDPAATLEEIKAFGYQDVPQGNDAFTQAVRAAKDVPLLLAAVEAALKLPAEWRRESEALRDAAGKVWEGAPDAAGVRLKHAYAAGYAECAKALEAAITAALTENDSAQAAAIKEDGQP